MLPQVSRSGTLWRTIAAAAWLLVACARPVTGGAGEPAAGPPLPRPPPPARANDSAVAARDGAALARLDLSKRMVLASATEGGRTDRDGVALSERVRLVISSELGRMPVLNVQDGKDHFPHHPVILLGPRIRPGQFGETDARMIGLPISAQNGKPSASKRDFVPSIDDVGATVLHWFGVDDPPRSAISVAASTSPSRDGRGRAPRSGKRTCSWMHSSHPSH